MLMIRHCSRTLQPCPSWMRQRCLKAPRPSQSPQTGPQKVEMDAQTQAQSPRDVFIIQVGSYCCEESTARMCAQLSAGPRTDTTLTDRKPPSCPLWECAWPGEARVVCKAKTGGLHLLRSPPTPAVRSASALWSLQVCRVRVGPAPQAMRVSTPSLTSAPSVAGEH